jgi:hypothetical protein
MRRLKLLIIYFIYYILILKIHISEVLRDVKYLPINKPPLKKQLILLSTLFFRVTTHSEDIFPIFRGLN